MELTLLHASDIHFGTHFDPEAADAFLRFLRVLAPDLLVISGDFTQRAKVKEYEEASAFLGNLRPIPVVVTPGNHDVPLYRIWERLFAPHRNYRAHISRELDTVTHVPGAVVVSLDSTAPLTAIVNGRIRDSQLLFAARAFDGSERPSGAGGPPQSGQGSGLRARAGPSRTSAVPGRLLQDGGGSDPRWPSPSLVSRLLAGRVSPAGRGSRHGHRPHRNHDFQAGARSGTGSELTQPDPGIHQGDQGRAPPPGPGIRGVPAFGWLHLAQRGSTAIMSPFYRRTTPGIRENVGAAVVAAGLALGVASVSFYLVRTFLAREPMEPLPRPPATEGRNDRQAEAVHSPVPEG